MQRVHNHGNEEMSRTVLTGANEKEALARVMKGGRGALEECWWRVEKSCSAKHAKCSERMLREHPTKHANSNKHVNQEDGRGLAEGNTDDNARMSACPQCEERRGGGEQAANRGSCRAC